MEFGVAYYPEQWPAERWAADAQMMAEMGIEVVRVGEFAWWRLEPRRERIDTGWLEEAVGVLRDKGLKVILGTPTAAPPRWLFYRHPNILPVRADGRRWYGGSRRHACLNNPAFNKYVRRIVSELARTFRDDRIWAWQVDNELGLGPTGVCYCDECERSFRRWLKRRYGSIDRVNRKWGTSFWSQGFSDWHEIPAPRQTVCSPHPSLQLDYYRFMSAQYRGFVQEQREIIEGYVGGDVNITVNEPSALDLPHMDMFEQARQQSIISLDNYPSGRDRLEETALGLDFARSLMHDRFWVLEQQAGAALISGHAQQPRPGQLKLWTYQAAARGAELINYFRWRTAPAGQEMHWYGLFDSEGTPRRRLQEIRGTIEDIKVQSDAWEGFSPRCSVAIMLDYDSLWALESTAFGWEVEFEDLVSRIYTVFRRAGIGVEFVDPDESLSSYEMVVAPNLFVATSALAKKLKVFAHDGGVFVTAAPAGYKDRSCTALDSPPPGPLTELLGVEITEHDILGDNMTNRIEPQGEEREFDVDGFCSVLKLRGAESLARYTSQFYSGTPAVTECESGAGQVLFTGAALQGDGWEWFLSRALERAGVAPERWASEDVEVVRMKNEEGEERLFVLNHAGEPRELTLGDDETVTDLLEGERYEGAVRMEPYGVALFNV